MATFKQVMEFIQSEPRLWNCDFVFPSFCTNYRIFHYPTGEQKIYWNDGSFKIGESFVSEHLNILVIVSEISEDGKEIWLDYYNP